MANEKSFDAVDTVGKAYKDGYQAAIDGNKWLNDCPYQERRLINAWDAGFNQGQNDTKGNWDFTDKLWGITRR